MDYPLISEYVEAIKLAGDNLDKLSYLRPVLDDEGRPIMSSGNFAVVFKMKDERNGKYYAIKCFIKEQEGRGEAYKLIADELEYVSSNFILQIKYLEKELFVDTNNSDETEFPVLLMDWIEGVTLDKYVRNHLYDRYALKITVYQFCRLATWLMVQPFAHGDLKPDNILVKEDGALVLVDYDGLFVPAMKGQKAREIGSPDYRHPLRTIDDFNEHIDDFSLATIAMQLYAIALKPGLLTATHGDSLILTEADYRDLSKCQMMAQLLTLVRYAEFAKLLGLFFIAFSENSLSSVSFRTFNIIKPTKPNNSTKSNHVSDSIWNLVRNIFAGRQSFVDPRDGNRYRTVKIGNQIWMAENLRYVVNLGNGAYVYGLNSTDVEEIKSSKNYKTYGLLYDMKTAKLACPEGWHIPSDEEWKELEMTFGMNKNACDMNSYKSMPESFVSFDNPRKGINLDIILEQDDPLINSSIRPSGFNARFAGWRTYQGLYEGLTNQAGWWSCTPEQREDKSSGFYFDRFIYENVQSIVRASCHNICCLSVRCIKDN